MIEYIPEPKFLGGIMKVELVMFNYSTKADLKNATSIDTSKHHLLKKLIQQAQNLMQINQILINRKMYQPVELI